MRASLGRIRGTVGAVFAGTRVPAKNSSIIWKQETRSKAVRLAFQAWKRDRSIGLLEESRAHVLAARRGAARTQRGDAVAL